MLRNIVVVLHEIGHAIPTLLLTRRKTTIFLGSYGIPETNGARFSIGKLEVWFTKDFLWNTGMCTAEAGSVSLRDKAILTLCGPLLPLVVAVAVFFTAERYIYDNVLFALLSLFMLLAFLDALYNLVPHDRPMRLTDGTFIFNDGKQLPQLWYDRKYQSAYREGMRAFETADYALVLRLYAPLADAGYANLFVMRALGYSASTLRAHDRALEWCLRVLEFDEADDNDQINAGLSYSRLAKADKAIVYYDNALQRCPGHPIALNNKGYSLAELGCYQQAEDVLDLAVAADPDYAYPYNNRAYVKMMLQRFDSAFDDLTKSMQLDDRNAYVHRNFGIYYTKTGNKIEAIRFLERAKALDAETNRIDHYIEEARLLR